MRMVVPYVPSRAVLSPVAAAPGPTVDEGPPSKRLPHVARALDERSGREHAGHERHDERGGRDGPADLARAGSGDGPLEVALHVDLPVRLLARGQERLTEPSIDRHR